MSDLVTELNHQFETRISLQELKLKVGPFKISVQSSFLLLSWTQQDVTYSKCTKTLSALCSKTRGEKKKQQLTEK